MNIPDGIIYVIREEQVFKDGYVTMFYYASKESATSFCKYLNEQLAYAGDFSKSYYVAPVALLE